RERPRILHWLGKAYIVARLKQHISITWIAQFESDALIDNLTMFVQVVDQTDERPDGRACSPGKGRQLRKRHGNAGCRERTDRGEQLRRYPIQIVYLYSDGEPAPSGSQIRDGYDGVIKKGALPPKAN